MREQRIAILLATDMGSNRSILRGIKQYALARPSWNFRIAWPLSAPLQELKHWRPDGIIGKLYTPKMADEVGQQGRPVINVSNISGDRRIPRAGVDELAIGRLAAEHFLERGFRSFAFVGYRQQSEVRDRRRGFCSRLQKAGFGCSSYMEFDLPMLRAGGLWGSVTPGFEHWVHSLAKPVAILAYQDFLAWELAELCSCAKLQVPEEVAIVGVDNDELFCALSFPALSSVSYPAEAIGFEAAKMLDTLLAGRRLPRRRIFLPPLEVVTRRSSDLISIDDPVLVAALRFIRQHETEPIAVKNLMDAVAVSRRSLEQVFRLKLGRSPLQEIIRVRIDRVRRLLIDTSLPIAEIARTSGFVRPERLSVLFKKKTGLTPEQYRSRYSARVPLRM